MDKVFLFIAKSIEGIGQPKSDSNQTIYGITKRWHPKYYQRLKKSTDDATIIDIYTKIYLTTKADKLPKPLNIHYFDMAFNMGEGDAVKVLQISLNKLGAKLTIDGDWGRKTQAASEAADTVKLSQLYPIIRRKYYRKHTRKNIRNGLLNRCDKLEEYIVLNNLGG